MKLLYQILIVGAVYGCTQRTKNTSDLRLHVDHPDDVRGKWGDPDTITRNFEGGIETEAWGYFHDTIGLSFVNGKLNEIRTAESERKRIAEKEREDAEIEARRREILDSVEASLQ